jgi:hypothetical protein
MADEWIVVRNWEKFQHYKNRWVPWIKFYPEILHDPTYSRLPESTRLLLAHIWLEYASARAQLPLDTRLLARRFNMRVTSAQVKSLVDAGFITLESRPCLEHVYMSSRPTRAREEEEVEKEKDQGQAGRQVPPEDSREAPPADHEPDELLENALDGGTLVQDINGTPNATPDKIAPAYLPTSNLPPDQDPIIAGWRQQRGRA